MTSTEKENKSEDWAELARKHANMNPVEKIDEDELKEDIDVDRDETNVAIAGITNGLSPLDL